mmetsp:Transcript_15151/g.29565  ORF Transcript_15151/g.29565 Transcript_15151/m.29565 type:complete len:250 (+) Transcript_15151:376-1125(+)
MGQPVIGRLQIAASFSLELPSQRQGICAALLALKHVTSGDSAVVPNLARLVRTNTSISLTLFDGETTEAAAVRMYRASRAIEAHILLGPGTSAPAQLLGALSNVDNFPMISHGAVSVQSEFTPEYQFFARTVFSNTVVTRAFPSLLLAFGWRACSVLYLNDPYISLSVSDFIKEAEKLGVVLPITARYDQKEAETIRNALQIIADSRVTVVIAVRGISRQTGATFAPNGRHIRAKRKRYGRVARERRRG